MSDIEKSVNKPYACSVAGCQYRGSSAKNLRDHQRRVHFGKLHTCDACEYSTRNPTNFKVHRRTHTGSKPFICNICGELFADVANLTRHTRIHHPDSVPAELRLVCQPCGFRAGNIYLLNRHLNTKTHQQKALAGEVEVRNENRPQLTHPSCTDSPVEAEALRHLTSKIPKKYAKYQKRIQKGKTSKNNTFKCPFCDYATDDVWDFLAHLRRIFVIQH